MFSLNSYFKEVLMQFMKFVFKFNLSDGNTKLFLGWLLAIMLGGPAALNYIDYNIAKTVTSHEETTVLEEPPSNT